MSCGLYSATSPTYDAYCGTAAPWLQIEPGRPPAKCRATFVDKVSIVTAVSKLELVSHAASSSGKQAVPQCEWQDDYTTIVTARVLQVHGKLAKAFIPAFEKQRKAGVTKLVYLQPPGVT